MGTIAAALAGGAAGAVGGGIIGALIGAGIPEERARRYDRGIREGNIVLGVTQGQRRTPSTSSANGRAVGARTSIGSRGGRRRSEERDRPSHER